MSPRDSDPRPTLESCAALLESFSAVAVVRRTLAQVVPEDARGVTMPLSALAREDGIRLADLAERIHLDLSVASRHVRTMEERGWIERRAHPTDGRSQTLHVTEAGQSWLKVQRAQFADVIHERLVGWSTADVDQLADLMLRFGGAMEGGVG